MIIITINILDIGIILLLIMDVIVGYKRGVIKELISLLGILLTFILSWSLKNIIGNFMCIYFPFFKFTGVFKGLSVINILFYQAIAFILVFCILLSLYEILLKVSKHLQKIVNMTIILIIPSKILGALVGLIKGIIILFIVLLLLVIPLGKSTIFEESKIINYTLYKIPILSYYTESFINPISEIKSIGQNVSNKNISIEKANEESINILIKYNVIDEKTVNKLYELNKIN